MNEVMVEPRQKARLDEIREQIEAGLAQLKHGEGIPGEQVFAALRQKSQQRRQDSSQIKSSAKSE